MFRSKTRIAFCIFSFGIAGFMLFALVALAFGNFNLYISFVGIIF